MIKSIFKTHQSSFTVRGSRFLTFAYPVRDEEEITEALENCKEMYPDATHHCYAWRVDPERPSEFANDDGEPSGTAGQPILNEIKSHQLINILIIVVRYFGGTKLGKPGLIDAYRTAARQCLEEANISEIQPVQSLSVTYPYSEQKQIDQLQHKYGLVKTSESYQAEVCWQVMCPEDHYPNLLSELEHLKHRGIRHQSGEKSYKPIS